MVAFTTNKALGMPVVGGDTGVWGQPINNNSSVLDASLGGSVSVPISSVSGALTLLASNYNNVFITFTGALTQNTVVTLPAVGSIYTIQNLTTTTSAFTVTLQTTAAGGQAIGCPPYQTQDIMTDGANVKFRGLPHVGTYWDYSGSSVPNWVSACTVPPWLNCDGTAFSSATYPHLSVILGSTTLPDAKGRLRLALDQGAGRVSSAISGIGGNTLLAAGGDQRMQLHNHGVNDPTHAHDVTAYNGGGTPGSATLQGVAQGAVTISAGAATGSLTGITIQNSGAGGSQNMPPAYVGGLTLIRAG